MAEVTVVLFAYLAELAGGQNEVRARGDTLDESLQDVCRTYPSLAAKLCAPGVGVVPSISVHLNGREVTLPAGLATPMREDDRLVFLPVVAGG